MNRVDDSKQDQVRRQKASSRWPKDMPGKDTIRLIMIL